MVLSTVLTEFFIQCYTCDNVVLGHLPMTSAWRLCLGSWGTHLTTGFWGRYRQGGGRSMGSLVDVRKRTGRRRPRRICCPVQGWLVVTWANLCDMYMIHPSPGRPAAGPVGLLLLDPSSLVTANAVTFPRVESGLHGREEEGELYEQ